VTTLLARYRRHGDTTADTIEVQVEGDNYDDALTQARARAVDGDDLLSVLTLEP
jgi:hypothetical protein